MFCQMMAFTLKTNALQLKIYKLVFNHFGRRPHYDVYFNPIIKHKIAKCIFIIFFSVIVLLKVCSNVLLSHN